MTRYVGIDLAKRSMRVCAVNAEIGRRGLKTDGRGRQLPCSFLRKDGVVAVEVCGFANTPARILRKQVGCGVHPLNPGGLATVRKSGKKTDREDALKIAKYPRDTPRAERVEVPLLTAEEEVFRADITMKEFLKKERNMALNRLHSLYGNGGDNRCNEGGSENYEGRKERHGELSPQSQVLRGFWRIGLSFSRSN